MAGIAMLFAISAPTFAQDYDAPAADCNDCHAITFKAGTLGLGLEYVKQIREKVNVKVGFNAFNYNYDSTQGGIDYDFDLNLANGGVLFDFHPSQGSFRITAGLMYNGNDIDATGKPTAAATYDIGGITYTSAQVGTMTGKIDFDNFAGYLGIGTGNALKKSGTTFLFDLGVLFQGSPKVTLNANGTLAANAAFMANLKTEEQQLQNDIDDFKIYPVVSIGCGWRF
jgi:hypothetical protein